MYNTVEPYVRFDSSAPGHWYQQELPIHSYIQVPGAFEDFTRASTVIDYKKGAVTRSKSKKVAQKRKLRKSVNQLEVLRKFFKNNPKPGRDSVSQLADATGLKFLEVRNWFRNARLRNKDDSMSNSYSFKNMDQDSNGFGEVSSSTGSGTVVLNSIEELARLWDCVDYGEKLTLLPKMFDTWEKNSTDRNEAVKTIMKCLTPQEKSFVHNYAKPRGPYRCSSDKTLSKTTILERAKNAWKELERMFGANKRPESAPQDSYHDNLSLNLDRDMLEGLKSLFQAHRDYLYYLVKEMGIDTSDEKDLGKLKTTQKYGLTDPVSADFIPQTGPQIGSADNLDMFQYAYGGSIPSHNMLPQGGYPATYPPLIPTAPTPIYPTACADYIPYSYNTPYPHSAASQNMVSGVLPPQFGRSPWVPSMSPQEERALVKSYYPEPDYGYPKTHNFSPDKFSYPCEPKSMMKQFSDMSSMTNYNNSMCGKSGEITQKCTFVKYYEVTYNKSSGSGAQTIAGSQISGQGSLPAIGCSPASKLEQLI